MWLARPIEQREPMRSTGLVAPGGSGWPGAMPTERLTWAASSVASPSEMCSSPNTSPGGNASRVPSPKWW